MNKPKVVVYQVASVDGRLALSPDKLMMFGDDRWTAVAGSGTEVWDSLKALHQPQAVLEGSGSFILEGQTSDPLPPVEGDPGLLYQDFLPDRILHRPGHQGWFTTVDGRGRIRWMYKEFPDPAWAGWHLLVLVSRRTPPEYLAYLRREDIPYLVAGDGHVDLGGALEKMAALLGVATLISTAGGKLNGALLRAGLMDEVNLNVFPALVGGTVTPSLFDAPELRPDECPTRLKLIAADVRDDDHLWLRYEVVRG